MELCQDRRGTMRAMEYLRHRARRAALPACPLAEIVFDFFDQLKSRTKGYASLDYHEDGEQSADLVKVDILLRARRSMRSVPSFTAIRRIRTV